MPKLPGIGITPVIRGPFVSGGFIVSDFGHPGNYSGMVWYSH
jgi:hypothetical protein